jgi:hypothetical protein
LLTAVQRAAREIKPLALGPVGIAGFDPSEFDGYARRTGSFRHGSHWPQANIPFIVEAWAYVADRKGHQVELTVLANRTPVVDDITGQRSYKGDVILANARSTGFAPSSP